MEANYKSTDMVMLSEIGSVSKTCLHLHRDENKRWVLVNKGGGNQHQQML